MTIFLDASAMVAIIAREPEATTFAHRLYHEDRRLTSAMAIWETVRGVQSARGIDLDEAEQTVAAFVETARLAVVPIGSAEAWAAIDAHRKCGMGMHEAGLNFGDCFSYACAKLHAETILFKGEDFIHTDLKDATLW